MSFFKNNEGIKTAELKLGDFDQIWTKFCFLDESGSLSNRTDPYFTIGILKMSMPYYLQSKILYERSRRNFHDEIKFNKISEKNIVNYDIKYANKLVTGDKNKLEIVEYLKAKLGTKTFTAGFQNHNFRIFVEQDNGHD
ncbi:MAG: hypothetical protein UW01_C0001G0133 [Candidatus Nomurabacteria bacterium GW2011_GWA2_43_66]|nr:MAG: hypothetical protein UW01_C0001G0133 [Candidatus Nomurabacteria bacterium GW2011_GWA2_43_66]